MPEIAAKMTTTLPALPMLFREALSNAGMVAIDEWWKQLDELARAEALRLWHDCGQSESELSVRVEARFIEEQEEDVGFWHSDYYDYLVNHEIYLFKVPGAHICTRHPVAEAAARAGIIPHDFSCPFGSTDCPMRRLLAVSPGRSLKLRVSLHYR